MEHTGQFRGKRTSFSNHGSRPGGSRFGSSRFGGGSRFGSGRFSRGGSFRGRAKKGFDPALLVKKAVPQVAQAPYIPKHTFADFNFDPKITANIVTHGYTQPTPIQDQTIPHLLLGKDLVGIANTGTGKTAAFLLPLIQKIVNNRLERILIVAPTRELAVQIQDECFAFTKQLGIAAMLCIGGVSMFPQISMLRRNPNIVIGTPGRLKDLKNQGHLDFSKFHTIVLDEVDRMLDMGFIADVRYIVAHLPPVRQSLFFSATLSPEIESVMKTFLKEPIMISVKTQATAPNVDQDIVKLEGKNKVDVLHNLLIKEDFNKVLIFGRTKWGIDKLEKELVRRGFRVSAIHGNKRQNQRQRALDSFRDNHVQILLATDVASRGLDIPDVSHVINYELPETYEDYVHRIGRTGRANKKGIALSFVD